MRNTNNNFSNEALQDFISAINSKERVKGLTHNFYNYPARFSPLFAKAAIHAFTKPGDLVIDPFLGGGTTLTEARALGRIGLGTDLNELAIFVSKVKTTMLSYKEAEELFDWCESIPNRISLSGKGISYNLLENPYLYNFHGKQLWPIRNTLHLGISKTRCLSSKKLQDYARCILLRTGQWAVDGKRYFPTASDIRYKIADFGFDMVNSSLEFTSKARKADSLSIAPGVWRTRCINKSAESIPKLFDTNKISPKLILTSPPYPGVHVLYHRWQVKGGKETAAPYWISDSADGMSGSYYTFGGRHSKQLELYFMNLFSVFSNLRYAINKDTLVVQLVAFSDKKNQLPRYLETMNNAGYSEITFPDYSSSPDDRLWRDVPNRKWHANIKGRTNSSKEVVLIHRLN